jgi:hypothetical protein
MPAPSLKVTNPIAFYVLSDRAVLEDLYCEMTVPEIARYLGVSVGTTYNWFRHHGIKMQRPKASTTARRRAARLGQRPSEENLRRRSASLRAHHQRKRQETERERQELRARLREWWKAKQRHERTSLAVAVLAVIEKAEQRRRRERERIFLTIAIADVVLRTERERVAQEAAPLAEAVRWWVRDVSTEPELVQVRSMLQAGRLSGASFDVAWCAALRTLESNGFRPALLSTVACWRDAYEGRGPRIGLARGMLGDD